MGSVRKIRKITAWKKVGCPNKLRVGPEFKEVPRKKGPASELPHSRLRDWDSVACAYAML